MLSTRIFFRSFEGKNGNKKCFMKEKFSSSVELWIWQFRRLAAWKHIFPIFYFSPFNPHPPSTTLSCPFPSLASRFLLAFFILFFLPAHHSHQSPNLYPLILSQLTPLDRPLPHFFNRKIIIFSSFAFPKPFFKMYIFEIILSFASMFFAVVIQFFLLCHPRAILEQRRWGECFIFILFWIPFLSAFVDVLFELKTWKKKHFSFSNLFFLLCFFFTGKKIVPEERKRCWRNWPDFALIRVCGI